MLEGRTTAEAIWEAGGMTVPVTVPGFVPLVVDDCSEMLVLSSK